MHVQLIDVFDYKCDMAKSCHKISLRFYRMHIRQSLNAFGLLNRDHVVSYNSRLENNPQINGAATFQFIVAAQAGVTVTCFFYLSGGLKEDTTVASSGEPTVRIWWLNGISSRYATCRHWSLYVQLDFTIVFAWAGHLGMSTIESSKLHLRSLHGRECLACVTSVKLR